jgi:hypothetical protein
MINSASPGAIVHPPPGEYVIEGQDNPVRMKSGVSLDLTGVILRQAPGYGSISNVISTNGASNINVLNGHLIGEKNASGISGRWGFGIRIELGSKNVAVRNTIIDNFWMDGIIVTDNANGVELDHVVCDRNRRQGVSVIDVDGFRLHHSQLSNSGGTEPGCGIDLEPDIPQQKLFNVTIEGNNVFFGNQGSDIAFNGNSPVKNLRVLEGNSFTFKRQPIYVAGAAEPLGTPWWAMILNRSMGWWDGYRWWGYPTSFYHA